MTILRECLGLQISLRCQKIELNLYISLNKSQKNNYSVASLRGVIKEHLLPHNMFGSTNLGKLSEDRCLYLDEPSREKYLISSPSRVILLRVNLKNAVTVKPIHENSPK